jgi:hypothetical protein
VTDEDIHCLLAREATTTQGSYQQADNWKWDEVEKKWVITDPSASPIYVFDKDKRTFTDANREDVNFLCYARKYVRYLAEEVLRLRNELKGVKP